MTKTKIICTLGPASDSSTVIRKMILSGMDVVRLNFSHGSHETHLKFINLVRALNKKYRRNIKILQDLEGYRIRIGKFKSKGVRSIELKKRQIFYLTNHDNSADKHIIPLDYRGDLRDFEQGSLIHIDDGYITFLVKTSSRKKIKVEALTAGLLKENKGINAPGIKLKFKDLTEKDKADLKFGLENKVDFIAQSFVRNEKDVLNIKEFINNTEKKPLVIAKIENRQGVDNIDQIINVSNGIMIARGDMGVSLPIQEVPIIQKMIIKKVNNKKKMVITATQMLESMTEHKRPTRAEVSDIANAVIDGSGYLMLSGESAIGKYPVESVKMMNSIIDFTERYLKRK